MSCKHPYCANFSDTAKTYCTNGCACDHDDMKRLQREERWSKIKIYQLDLISTTGLRTDYNLSCLVAAHDAKTARKLASEKAMDEGSEIWLNPKKSRCYQLKIDKLKTGIIMIESIAG